MPVFDIRPRSWIKPDPNQPRKSFDLEAIDRLGHDMLNRGTLVPLIVRTEGDHAWIIDGERRWMAAGRVGIKELPMLIFEKPPTSAELKGIQLATAIHRAQLTDYERYLACTELMKLNPEWQYSDLAKFLNMQAPAITKLMSVSKCSRAWQEALAEERVGLTECYIVSSLPEAEQARLLSQKLSGASRDDIAISARKLRNGEKEPAKLTRVNFTLPSSGVRIAISGTGQSLDDLYESLSESLREVRRAREQGHDVKAFRSLMAAKNKNRTA